MYYGLCLNVGSFGINIYVTQFVFGAVEIPANMVSLALNQRIGRRLSQSSSLIFGGAACLLTLAVPQGTLDTLSHFSQFQHATVFLTHVPFTYY